MRLVEEALLAVAEEPPSSASRTARVRDVRDRGDDDAASSATKGRKRRRSSRRVAQVLEHVREEDGVEALAAELGLEVELLGVADEDAFRAGSRPPARPRVELDADDGRSESVASAWDM